MGDLARPALGPEGPLLAAAKLASGMAMVFAMFVGYGWCVLRTARPAVVTAREDALDEADAADRDLWDAFRRYMDAMSFEWIEWNLIDHLNNESGVLTFVTSRNHRRPDVFTMLSWIAEHGPKSYGLLYVEDMEDVPERVARRGESGDLQCLPGPSADERGDHRVGGPVLRPDQPQLATGLNASS